MKTMRDAILEHVKILRQNNLGGTMSILELFDLPTHNKKLNTIANHYWEAVRMISDLQDKIEELEKQIK